MNPKDKQGFFADRSTLNPADYVIFDYYFESTIEPEDAAEIVKLTLKNNQLIAN